MSDAFRCDCCDEFYSGTPAISVELTGRTWGSDGKTWLKPRHEGGYDDVDPIEGPNREIEWPSQNHLYEMCAVCFLVYVAGSLREALQMGRYGDD